MKNEFWKMGCKWNSFEFSTEMKNENELKFLVLKVLIKIKWHSGTRIETLYCPNKAYFC